MDLDEETETLRVSFVGVTVWTGVTWGDASTSFASSVAWVAAEALSPELDPVALPLVELLVPDELRLDDFLAADLPTR